MQVSVVLATFNGARFLGEQLQSLADQTLQPHEVVVCDDGSTDATLAVINRFSNVLPLKVRVNSTTLGYGDNFLSGAARAQGDLIAFCDQDDRWYPHKLERCAKVIVGGDLGIVVHATTVVDGDGCPTGRLWPKIRADRVLPRGGTPIAQCLGMAMMFRRSLLDGVSPDDRPRSFSGHDHWLSFIGSSQGRTGLIAEPLADYRLHGKNVFGIFRPSSGEKLRLVLRAGPETYREESRVFTERAEYLLQLAAAWEAVDPGSGVGARCLADGQLRVAGERERRARLYDADGVVRRLAAFAQILQSCAYRSDSHEGLGGKALMKDVLQTLTGRVVRR